MRYSPGSLVEIVCADRVLRDRFVARVIDEQSAVLSLDKVRALLAGKLPADQVEEKAQALLDAAASKRFASGQTVVIPLEGLDPEERERYVRLAAAHRRARHLVLVEAAKDAVRRGDARDADRAADRAGRGRTGPGGLHDLAAARRARDRRAQEDRLRAAPLGRLGVEQSPHLRGGIRLTPTSIFPAHGGIGRTEGVHEVQRGLRGRSGARGDGIR